MRLSLPFVLSAALIFGCAAADKCARGESYWCSDLRAAKDCGAIKHCTTTVWQNQILTSETTPVCEFCQAIVGDVHKFISDKSTETEIGQFLSSACSMIPSQAAADECKTVVQDYTPEIIDLIVANVKPQVVCALLKLCTGLEDTVQHSDEPTTATQSPLHRVPLFRIDKSKPKDTPLCTDCQKFMNDIRDYVINNEKQIEQELDQQICVHLGSLQKECEDLVKTYTSLLVNFTMAYFDGKMICQEMGFCTGSSVTSRLTPETLKLFGFPNKASSVENCMICKTLLSWVQSMDRDATVQNEVKNFLKTDVCAHLGQEQSTCTELIDRFAPTVFKFIATVIDPDTRCHSFGFCDTEVTAPVESSVIRLATPVEATPPKSEVSPQCVLCEFVMKELDAMLAANATEAEIIAALDKVCSVLPSTIRTDCTDFVNTYGPVIIELLKAELDPAKVCTFLGLCTASKTTVEEKKIQTIVRDDEKCTICKIVIQYVEAVLQENATVEDVERVVEKICGLLPDTMKQQCDAMIEEYAPFIVQYITMKYDPEQVCQMIKLCASKTGSSSLPMETLTPAKPRHVGTYKCTYGPSYWCTSQQNAEICGAVEHCKKYVWKN